MATMTQDRELPSPTINPENAPFFEATAQGRLMLKSCEACARVHWYPRVVCPHCFSPRTRWIDAKGTGRIYTFAVLRVGAPQPYALAYVELDEGVRMMTNIVDCDLDALAIDMRVRVVFKKSVDGPMVPMFTPVT